MSERNKPTSKPTSNTGRRTQNGIGLPITVARTAGWHRCQAGRLHSPLPRALRPCTARPAVSRNQLISRQVAVVVQNKWVTSKWLVDWKWKQGLLKPAVHIMVVTNFDPYASFLIYRWSGGLKSKAEERN